MSDHLFTADLHLGHKLVAEMRGFDSWQEHDNFIMGRLKSAVRKQDTLWILGDYSTSMHAYARNYLSEIPCRKILVPGNHDPEHGMHRSAWKYQRKAMDVFDAVLPFARVRLQKINFLMSHLPYRGEGDHTEVERYNEYRLSNELLPLLCGHVHEAWRFNGNQFNVGVDVNDFKPVTSTTVLDWWRTETA